MSYTLIDNDTGKDIIETLNNQKEEIERLQEENLLLKASEPMSKLAEDYGYKTRCEKAIEYIKKHGDYNKSSGCTEELDLYKINELLEILDKVGSDKNDD